MNFERLSKIINIAVASARSENITLPTKQIIRGQIHLMIYGHVGSGKSHIMNKIANETKAIKTMGLTRSTLLGSVDKSTGTFTPPAIWDARNSVLLIDEFYVEVKGSERSMLNVLLPVMETNPEYKKRYGYRCNDFDEEEGGLFCKVKNNTIHCKSRFVFIANTMMDLEHTKMQELIALKSRCIVIKYSPSLDTIFSKLNGEPDYIYKKINNKHKKITKQVFKKLIEKLKTHEIKAENVLRTFGDLCRVYHVIGWNDEILDDIVNLTINK